MTHITHFCHKTLGYSPLPGSPLWLSDYALAPTLLLYKKCNYCNRFAQGGYKRLYTFNKYSEAWKESTFSGYGLFRKILNYDFWNWRIKYLNQVRSYSIGENKTKWNGYGRCLLFACSNDFVIHDYNELRGVCLCCAPFVAITSHLFASGPWWLSRICLLIQ